MMRPKTRQGGTNFPGPLFTQEQVPGMQPSVYGIARGTNFHARCEYFEDFLGDAVVGEAGAYDLSPTGAPTTGLKADEANGVVQYAPTADNEQQIAGYYWTDQRTIAGNKGPYLEFRYRIDTAPGANERIVMGLASDFAVNPDAIATNLWFRLEASLALLAETDEATTDNDDQSTGITLVAGVWYWGGIDARDPANVRFWHADAYAQKAKVVKTLNAAALDGTTLQPFFVVMKDSGTGVPKFSLDAFYVQWYRQ